MTLTGFPDVVEVLVVCPDWLGPVLYSRLWGESSPAARTYVIWTMALSTVDDSLCQTNCT